MEAIVKIISFFIGLFVLANGIWVAYMPPYGDEMIGYLIIAAGIVIPILTLYVSKISESRYD